MRQFILTIITIFIALGFVKAQGGLDGIIVEKMYVATAADAAADPDGILTEGSTIYRVYVDLKPGYDLLSIYGQEDITNNKIDTLKIFSDKLFYNHLGEGKLFGYEISSTKFDDANMTLFDSWFTSGRVGSSTTATGFQGITKPLDGNGSILNIPALASLYNNTAGSIGLPIKTADGFITPGLNTSWTSPNFATEFGSYFSDVVSPTNSIASVNTAIGNTGAVDIKGSTSENIVLIGQFTTLGTGGFFGFKLNMQLRLKDLVAGTQIVEEWVAETPQAGQFTHPSLTREPNVGNPTVSLTAPTATTHIVPGTTSVTATATASDVAPGTVAKVEFYVGATKVGEDLSSPYSLTFVPAAQGDLTAVAIDNQGATTTSTPAVILNAVPSVTAASPAAAVTGQIVTLTASATDVAPGTVTSVEFFVDNVSVGTDGSAPFEFSWTATVGAHTVKATATDNNGGTATSTDVNITVSANQAPVGTVSATPLTLNVGGTVTLTSSWTDADGTVSSVAYFDGATQITGTVGAAPTYSLTWTPTAGAHAVTAKATDNLSGVGTSTNTENVAVNARPIVNFTAPASGAMFAAGQTINVTANASDDVSVASVDFTYNGSTITVSSAPYAATFTAANGVNSITAVAKDGTNFASTTATLAIQVGANPAPTVTMAALPAQINVGPLSPTYVFTGTASDNGTVALVEVFMGATKLGDATITGTNWSYTWNTSAVAASPSVAFSAKATDDLGSTATTPSQTTKLKTATSTKYGVRELSEVCNNETLCVPIEAKVAAANIIGFDIELKYNKNKVAPTGVIRKGVLAPVGYVETSFSIKTTSSPDTNKMLVAVYFNTTAPATARFAGLGDIICVEFAKKPAFGPSDVVKFDVNKLQESYIDGVELEGADPGNFTTFRDTTFASSLKFWVDRSPISYVAGTNHPTTIFGSNGTCVKEATNNPGVSPDVNGEFTHILRTNQLYLAIEKDIDPLTDVQPVINGFDALLTRKVILEDLSFIPTIYQILAMDVNLDGVVSAGDVSQINQRAVLKIGEYRQEWNYDNNGDPTPGQLSKDWLFVEESKPLIEANYTISATYPRHDGTGYNKDNVPTQSFCAATPVSDWSRCPIIGNETYIGYLLGDVNGNWANQANSTDLRSTEFVTLDLSKAIVEGNNVKVPVLVNANSEVSSIDFALQYEVNINFVSTSSTMQNLAFYNENDQTLRYTSNSLTTVNTKDAVAYVTFDVNGNISERDFNAVAAYINGEKINFNVVSSPLSTEEVLENTVIYPNPASDKLTIVTSKDAKISILDMSGRVVRELGNANAGSNSFDISSVATGVYSVRVTADNASVVKKLFVTK